ncbi:uncharacterized protein HaLaN_06018, partial [Haematococcus lacustris]
MCTPIDAFRSSVTTMHTAQRVWPRWSRNCPSAALLRAGGARCWQHSASLHRTHRSPSVAVRAQPGGQLGDEEGLDVAVFRFTLGIKGFEDRFIPRVVGAVAAALMALNHLLGAQPAAAAQVRVEYLCLLLAAICVAVPEIEDRLKEVLP